MKFSDRRHMLGYILNILQFRCTHCICTYCVWQCCTKLTENRLDSKTLAWVLVLAKIELAVHFVLPKWIINKFKLVQQKKTGAKVYCPNVYTVTKLMRFPIHLARVCL